MARQPTPMTHFGVSDDVLQRRQEALEKIQIAQENDPHLVEADKAIKALSAESLVANTAEISDHFQQVAEDPRSYSYDKDGYVNPEQFRGHRRFMSRALKRYAKRQAAVSFDAYKNDIERIPYNFESMDVAEAHLKRTMKGFLNAETRRTGRNHNSRQHLTMNEAIATFKVSRLAATVMSFEGYDNKTLMFYDYDSKLYTYDDQVAARWLTVLMGSASSQNLKTFIMSLQADPRSLAIYQPLPRWKIAVGNGVYNTITRTLEPYHPREVVTSKIETNYYSSAIEPRFSHGKTFEDLVSDLANGNAERAELIIQMAKAIVTGYMPNPAVFIMLGKGGDGKSLFMNLLSRVVGLSNTGALNFSDMNDEAKAVAVAQKRLIIGMDNDFDVMIHKLAFFKSAASQEVASFNRKFLSAVSLRVTGVIVQLCNNLPRFRESGPSIRRRIVMISCERSHYEAGDQINDLAESIKSKYWHEYILKYLLEEEYSPYFSDFNDCDNDILNQSLDAEDPVGQFYLDLERSGVLGVSTPVLPKSLLYAMFRDWMTEKFPGAKLLTSRTFDTKSNGIVREYGFETVQGSGTASLETIERAFDVDFAGVLGRWVDGPFAESALDSDVTGFYYSRVSDRQPLDVDARSGRRSPAPCDALNYFGVWSDVESDVEHHPGAFVDLLDDEGVSYVVESVEPVVRHEVVDEEARDADLMAYYEASFDGVVPRSAGFIERLRQSAPEPVEPVEAPSARWVVPEGDVVTDGALRAEVLAQVEDAASADVSGSEMIVKESFAQGLADYVSQCALSHGFRDLAVEMAMVRHDSGDYVLSVIPSMIDRLVERKSND